jgi:hypothetical protein
MLLAPIKIGDLELGLLEWDPAPDWKIAESRGSFRRCARTPNLAKAPEKDERKSQFSCQILNYHLTDFPADSRTNQKITEAYRYS